MAAFAPYYFANHNQGLQNYFNTAQLHDYSYFTEDLPNAAPMINYGGTFGSQGTVFAQRDVTITDTVNSHFSFSPDDVHVSVGDADGNLLNPQPDSTVTVDGQNISIRVSGIESENRVLCEVFCTSSGSFTSEENGFQNTNDGDASASLTGSKESPLVLPSPRLYSQPVSLPNTGGSGRRVVYSGTAPMMCVLAILCYKKQERKNNK